MMHQKEINTLNKTRKLLAREALFGFLITFILLRILVYLIMSKTIPDTYVFFNGIHIHHFNEGIFMLTIIAGYTLFAQPQGRILEFLALFYGIAIALTFDEFGMWLNFNVTYWQRISIDMAFIIMTFLGIIAFAPSWRELNLKKCILLFIVFMGYVLAALEAGQSHWRSVYGAELQQMQRSFTGHS
jgi:hypothetical protein